MLGVSQSEGLSPRDVTQGGSETESSLPNLLILHLTVTNFVALREFPRPVRLGSLPPALARSDQHHAFQEETVEDGDEAPMETTEAPAENGVEPTDTTEKKKKKKKSEDGEKKSKKKKKKKKGESEKENRKVSV